MKFNFKTMAILTAILFLGFGCTSPMTRMPSSLDKVKDLKVSLDSGTWCYVVYQSNDAKVSHSIIEIKTAVNDQCPIDSRKAAALGRDISLVLMNPNHQRSGDSRPMLSQASLVSFEVVPVTTMQLLVGSDGSTNQWSIVAMKNGVVKFFNDRSKAPSIGGSVGQDSRTILELPKEFEDIIYDAAKANGNVIVTIRDEVQDGKKGLNSLIR